jgi:DNA helicase-2/ATP-dependent DNA helicase PcrA
MLRQRGIPYVELLRSTSFTRKTAGALGNLLHCLADPTSARKLATAFRVWKRNEDEEGDAADVLKAVAGRIRRCPAVESYLWPRADHDWIATIADKLSVQETELLEEFRESACRWHRAAVLPIDQLVLTLAGELFQDAVSLALVHKLAGHLRRFAEDHVSCGLSELVQQLAVIARNERRFLGFSGEDMGFKPPPGEVTVATMHKAKGLEWDRVYLMSVNNYSFPSAQPTDTYISEPWYVRDGLNLEAEAVRQLEFLEREVGDLSPPVEDLPVEGAATLEAREQYVAERLRLLYVGITRARRDLIVTWNRGKRAGHSLQPALPFVELQRYLSERVDELGDGGPADLEEPSPVRPESLVVPSRSARESSA